ncbi:hypothetical protein OROGR_022966 [Orobanche gracilis]
MGIGYSVAAWQPYFIALSGFHLYILERHPMLTSAAQELFTFNLTHCLGNSIVLILLNLQMEVLCSGVVKGVGHGKADSPRIRMECQYPMCSWCASSQPTFTAHPCCLENTPL